MRCLLSISNNFLKVEPKLSAQIKNKEIDRICWIVFDKTKGVSNEDSRKNRNNRRRGDSEFLNLNFKHVFRVQVNQYQNIGYVTYHMNQLWMFKTRVLSVSGISGNSKSQSGIMKSVSSKISFWNNIILYNMYLINIDPRTKENVWLICAIDYRL